MYAFIAISRISAIRRDDTFYRRHYFRSTPFIASFDDYCHFCSHFITIFAISDIADYAFELA